ncbi:MAG: DUF3298 and DUF4163 domain-containing protein [Negativicutes bacterium]|nr:DUF3298 and DUF4163 domain-containing protein [Negativicutes bacterium]
MKTGLTFIAICLTLAVTAAVSAHAVTVVSYDFSGPFINCSVPQINGMANKDAQQAVNQFLLNQVQPELTAFQQSLVKDPANADPKSPWQGNLCFESSYSVKFQRSFLLSIVQDEYWFSGGAHGMAVRKAANINTETGHIYSLDQLFKPGSDWLKVLNAAIAGQIAVRSDSSEYKFNGITSREQFYLIDEGLVVYFQPYEIGPWVLGMPKFVIPWYDLHDLVNDNLPLAG